jgi:hypothetical protein
MLQIQDKSTRNIADLHYSRQVAESRATMVDHVHLGSDADQTIISRFTFDGFGVSI